MKHTEEDSTIFIILSSTFNLKGPDQGLSQSFQIPSSIQLCIDLNQALSFHEEPDQERRSLRNQGFQGKQNDNEDCSTEENLEEAPATFDDKDIDSTDELAGDLMDMILNVCKYILLD